MNSKEIIGKSFCSRSLSGMKVLLVLLFCFMLSGQAVYGQQQKSKYVIYTFTVTGVKSKADADKLDKFMLERKGIVSSKTDVEKKTVEVKAESMIDYQGIMNVVKAMGFEASEEHKAKNVN